MAMSIMDLFPIGGSTKIKGHTHQWNRPSLSREWLNVVLVLLFASWDLSVEIRS